MLERFLPISTRGDQPNKLQMDALLLPISTRGDQPLQLQDVLRTYYPDLDLGKTRDPLETLLANLDQFGIVLNQERLSRLREGSRVTPEDTSNLAELFLFNALKRDPSWKTPSPGGIMGQVAKIGLSIQEYSVHGVLKSEGLSNAIADHFPNATPKHLTLALRGMRIDGAYIAMSERRAFEELQRCTNEYIHDREQLPPSLQNQFDMVNEMRYAKTSKEIYSYLYAPRTEGQERSGARTVGSFVPYELMYWNFLAKSGILTTYQHLPFSQIVIDTHGKQHHYSDWLHRQVESESGVPLDNDATILRTQMIRNDFPKISGK